MPDRINILEAQRISGAPPPSVLREPSPEEYEAYFHDESKLESPSLVSLALPRSTAEVAGLLTEHAREKNFVNFAGARTGVVGGVVADRPVHLVSLERLQGVVSVDVERQRARIRSGTALRVFNEHLAQHHPALFFPVDPTETSASVGGLVSTNAGGARSFAFGSLRKWVTGIEVVLADGSLLLLRRGEKHAVEGEIVLETSKGSRSFRGAAIPKPETKNCLGYSYGPSIDPIDIFIGSEGTLGAITEVELELIPRFTRCLYMIQFFPAAEQALKFVLEIRRSLRADALAAEFLDSRSIDLVRRAGKCGAFADLVEKASGGAVYCEFRCDGDEDAALERITERLEVAVNACGGSQDHSMAGMTDAELREIKRFRHAVPEQANIIIAQRRKEYGAIHKLSTDMAVPEPDLEWVFNLYQTTLEREGVEYLIFGHAGNSHLHMNMLPRNPLELEKAKAIYLELAEQIVGRGGAVAGEHGIGRIKKDFLKVQYSEEHLGTMRGIKSFFDPEWRLSPGILLDHE